MNQQDNQQWVVTSLLAWGVFITTLTGLLPAVNSLFHALGHPDFTLSPEWVSSLDQGVRSLINAAGMVVGLVLIVWDRLKAHGGVKRQLTLLPTQMQRAKLKGLVFDK